MVCGLVGGRLTHVFYENWGYYREMPFDIFKIWQGGFVFYGGFFTSLIGAYGFLKIKKESFLKWADFFAPVLALGYALGRVGCFLNGCCFGKPCVGNGCALPWMVEFNHPGLPEGLRHPTQLYAVFWELLVVLTLLWIEKVRHTKNTMALQSTGFLFFTWLGLHSLGRLIMEYHREDYRGPEISGLSLSSWLSIGILFLLFLVVLFKFTLYKSKILSKKKLNNKDNQ